jgi:SAM-dependent methyltransferase
MDVGAAQYLAERRAEAEALLEERDGRITLRADVAHYGCPYCGSTEGIPYAGALAADRMGYEYRECAMCGIVYPWPRLNAETLRWRATSPSMNHYLQRSLSVEPERLTPPFPEPFFRGMAGRRVLEVGPGAGRLLRFLRSVGADVLGVEPNEVAAKFCQAAGCPTLRESFEEDLITRSLLTPGSFDAVIFSESLPHLFDMKAALRLARTLLKPGGTLVVKAFDIAGVHLRLFVQASRGIDGLSIPTNGSARTYRRIIGQEGFLVRKFYRQPGSLLDQAGFCWPALRRRWARLAFRGLDLVADAGLRICGHSRNFVLVAEKV